MIMITFTRSLTLFNIHYKASTFLLFTQNIQIKWCPIFIIIFLLRVKSGVSPGFWKHQNGDIQLSNTAFKLKNCSRIAELTSLKRSVLFQQNMKIKLWKKDICSLTLPRMVKNYLKQFPLTFNFDFFWRNLRISKIKQALRRGLGAAKLTKRIKECKST